MQHNTKQLQARRSKGIAVTIMVHALLLLSFFLFSFDTPVVPPPELEGILINLGNSDDGSGEEQPLREGDFASDDEATQATNETSQATAESQQPAAQSGEVEGYTTQDYEQSTTMNEGTSTAAATQPNTNETPTTATTTPTNATPNTTPAEAVRKANANALFKAKNHNGSGGNNASENNNSTSEGNGAGNGDKGATNGDPNATNYGNWSTGMGSGGGVDLNMSGRKFKQKPVIKDDSQETGTVVLKIKVNSKGRVTLAEFYSKGSTTSNQGLVQKAITAVKQSYINESDMPEQTGYVRIVFKVK
jgi:hypothetical protein